MKILIIQHDNFLNGRGGTEKICSFLANILSEANHKVTIATNDKNGGQPVFLINDKVEIKNIFSENIPQIFEKKVSTYSGKNPILWLKNKLKRKYQKASNKLLISKNGGFENFYKSNLKNRSDHWKKFIDGFSPDLIITMSVASALEISFEQNYSCPIINSVNGRPDYDYKDDLWYRSEVEMQLLRDTYKKINGLQILFESYKAFVPNTFSGVLEVIPNPVPKFSISRNLKDEEGKFIISHIGSLVLSCKQQDVLIDVFSEIHKIFPNWELHFYGTGNGENLLKEKIQNYNLQDKVFLKGFTQNPMDKLAESDIFAFPSAYEGFPLALTEAMSAGLPTLGFDYCSGVNELIDHNKNGFLAKDKDGLKKYLTELMQNQNLRETFGENGKEKMRQFDEKIVAEKWLKFISKMAENEN